MNRITHYVFSLLFFLVIPPASASVPVSVSVPASALETSGEVLPPSSASEASVDTEEISATARRGVTDQNGGGKQTNGVSIQTGPTPIPGGDALGEEDITLQNSLFAVSFAVETRPPWGVARGGILDLAIIREGEYQNDIVSLVDFLPDSWSSWPSTWQEVTILEDQPERGVVQVKRDWHDVELVTTFTLKRGEDRLHVHTDMSNQGERIHDDILSGYILWADGGYFFNRPGLEAISAGKADQAFTDWSGSYEEDWALVFHAPFATHVDYDGQDQYREHSLKPGDTISFEGWLQVIPKGETAAALDFEIERKEREAGRIHGSVETRGGDSVKEPVVLAEKDGETYTWSVGENGSYDFRLPEGIYRIRAMAEGYSISTARDIQIRAGEQTVLDFSDLEEPGNVTFHVHDEKTQQPVDARIEVVRGQTYPVEYLGRRMMFTDLYNTGSVQFSLAPGEYQFKTGSGAGFTSRSAESDVSVVSGESLSVEVPLDIRFRPRNQNWYSADLHHHSDILDGVTPVEKVLRAQLAAGLDFAFLSDHDSGLNNIRMDSLAEGRGIPFIPSMEVSPSWGHFNVFPVDLDAQLQIDPSEASPAVIFDDARRMGAEVISVNHPYISYGYFHSFEEDLVPGGFVPDFNLVELNYGGNFEEEMERMFSFWNQGLDIYLAAGSDTHDVWGGLSGAIRMMVYIPGEPDAGSFAREIKRGHAYATTGPLIEPGYLFGSRIRIEENQQLTLPFSLMSVHGLENIRLISEGEVKASMDLTEKGETANIHFEIEPDGNSWYSVIVEDAAGNKAYSNPVWIRSARYE